MDHRRDYCDMNCYHDDNRVHESAADRRRAWERKRRAAKAEAESEPYTRREVGNRDGWRCGLCGKRVNRKLRWPDPMSQSVDHIVPLSRGGDDVLSNVQIAHLFCNLSKAADRGPAEQLRLV